MWEADLLIGLTVVGAFVTFLVLVYLWNNRNPNHF